MVQPGEFAREVEAQSVPGDVLARGAAVETLKNMQLGLTGNGRTGVADREDRPPALAARREADPAAGTIVFSRVFQQILQDQGEVTFFPGHEKRGRDFRLDREVGVIRQGAEIIDPGINQRRLRWQFAGAGILLMLGGLAASNFLSARLSVPVVKLAVDSEENRAQRARAEAALGLTSEELQRSARFSADASHQLKTPVTVLRAGLEELLAGETVSAEMRADLSALIHQTFRLTSVIEDLLLLSRMDAGRLQIDFRSIDLKPLIDAWIDDLGALPDYADLAVETEVPPALLVAGEERYLTLILQNLLENARKYNRPGGRIRLAARSEGGWAVLTVGNTGPPIPRQAQLHIFERFHRGTAGEDIPGHGLGLNLARELARLHHGELRLTRSDEGWTEFEVRFRLAGGASATVSAIA